MTEGGERIMETTVGENEPIETALKRFRRQCQKEGVLAEVKKREYYDKPSVRRKKKAIAARRRRRR